LFCLIIKIANYLTRAPLDTLGDKLTFFNFNFNFSFLSPEQNGGTDIYIKGLRDRNRALNNDIVVIKLKEKYTWKLVEAFKSQAVIAIKEYENENRSELNADLVDLLAKTALLSTEAVASSPSGSRPQGSNNNRSQDEGLIDLAPLSFTKPELLNCLKDDWFQRSAVVSKYF
jgi:hypothetical protein